MLILEGENMYNYNLRADYYNYENNNYNNPTYTENVNPNKVYDPYQGFIRGNMFKNLYNSYKLKEPVDIQAVTDKDQLLILIDALNFAQIDISLYLTIYPEDKDMLNLFNQYRMQKNAVIGKYEQLYGPLTIDSDALERNPWAWNKNPWPWEN